jgi:HAD superfamily hydrolase (TIGR01549 family)
MIEVVSFDLDGTLVSASFADKYWLEGLPKIYAREKGISIEKAKSILLKDYESVGREGREWYEPSYWFDRYNLNYSWKKLIEDYSNFIELYPDVVPVLEKLKGKYKLIILSNAERSFIDIELKKTGIVTYFSNVFSSISDFGLIKKDVEVYRRVCSILGVDEERMVHIGDDKIFDYEIPRSMGIKSILIDREESNSEGIKSLEPVPNIINRF